MVKNAILVFCFLGVSANLLLFLKEDAPLAAVFFKITTKQESLVREAEGDSEQQTFRGSHTSKKVDNDGTTDKDATIKPSTTTIKRRDNTSISLGDVRLVKAEYLLNGGHFLPSFNKNDILPSWSKLPRTRFTDHVLELVTSLNVDSIDDYCAHKYKLIVPSGTNNKHNNTSNNIPIIQCEEDKDGDETWCKALQRTFATKSLPYNVSIGFMLNDFFSPKNVDNACIGSSSAGGKFCMPNMADLEQMASNDYILRDHQTPIHHLYRHEFGGDAVPWEDRDPMPIFRGTAWPIDDGELCQGPHKNFTYEDFMEYYPTRFRAVDFSIDHPDLLNARFSHINYGLDGCMELNATNGLSKLLPVVYTSNEDYFALYQTALVLKGIGAAFRMSVHFLARTAVVLQEIEGYQEWFTPYLQPYVHYIPLAADLSNIMETMKWIRGNPIHVEAIAANSRAFYERYLSFSKSDEHIYELVYRLSEYRQYVDSGQAAVDIPTGRSSDTRTVNATVLPISAGETLPIFDLKEPLPSWSGILPRTLITDHVLDLTITLGVDTNACPEHYDLVVKAPHTIPSVVCNPSTPSTIWCKTLQRIFVSRTLARNVSIGFVSNHTFEPIDASNSCLRSSNLNGKFCMPNMDQLQQMSRSAAVIKSQPKKKYEYSYKDNVPWEDRLSVPIYRSPAMNREHATCAVDVKENHFNYQDFINAYPPSFRVVDFSVDHPDLLDARFESINPLLNDCFAEKDTNGLSKLLPIDALPYDRHYFEKHQAALILETANGANFRLSLHMMTRTAVILQDSDYQEWFTRLLTPYVHYIPLAADLSNLNETMHWVKDHPKKVRKIGENGRTFYEQYLTFFQNDNHIYELVHRLSEFRHFYQIEQ